MAQVTISFKKNAVRTIDNVERLHVKNGVLFIGHYDENGNEITKCFASGTWLSYTAIRKMDGNK